MCLLIVDWRRDEQYALVLAANRDERYDRATQPFTVLRANQPRTLGGKDLVAKGTWLAVNEFGVVAGLTNTPSLGGPDPAKRSRGEVPLLLSTYASAREAVEVFVETAQPGTYNPARLLVGDREHLYYVELANGDHPTVFELAPGLYILENAPLDGSSSKARFVDELLGASSEDSEQLWRALPAVVASHDRGTPTATERARASGLTHWSATRSPCVHTDGYGTRSSIMVRIANERDAPIEIRACDGPPCVTSFRDVTTRWSR